MYKRQPGDLFSHKVNVDVLQKGPPTTALPVLVKAATAWKRHLEGGYTWRRRDRTKRRRGAASNLVSIVDDGLGPSAFAHLILGSGFCAPSDLGRLSRVAACFGATLEWTRRCGCGSKVVEDVAREYAEVDCF